MKIKLFNSKLVLVKTNQLVPYAIRDGLVNVLTLQESFLDSFVNYRFDVSNMSKVRVVTTLGQGGEKTICGLRSDVGATYIEMAISGQTYAPFDKSIETYGAKTLLVNAKVGETVIVYDESEYESYALSPFESLLGKILADDGTVATNQYYNCYKFDVSAFNTIKLRTNGRPTTRPAYVLFKNGVVVSYQHFTSDESGVTQDFTVDVSQIDTIYVSATSEKQCSIGAVI